MRFAHTSDFHYTDKPEGRWHVRNDIVSAFRALMDDLLRVEKHLDFIAISGDLTEFGDDESYIAVRTELEKFHLPVFLVPGNHDLREALRRNFSPGFQIPTTGPLDFHTETAGVQVIGLDTLVEGEHHGRLTNEQLDWLEQKLASNLLPHSVVMLHHAPFQTGVGFFDRLSRTDGQERFGDIVGRARSDVTLLCGHTHRPYQANWCGANCYVSGALASQFGGEEPFGDGKVGVIDEPFAYFIHTLGGRGDHVVATRYVDLNSPHSQ